MKTLVYAICCTLFLIYSCGSNHDKIISVDSKFSTYVAAYSSGMQARVAPIRVELVDRVDSTILAKLHSHNPMDSTLLDDIFELSPSVAGHAVWVNERVVEFKPDEPLKSSQLYTVTFKLDQLAKVEEGYEEFVFQIATFQQLVTLESTNLYHYDDYHTDWYYLTTSISTSDLPDTSHIDEVLTCTFNGKKKPVRLTHEYYDTQYYFQIDSIERGENEQELVLEWNGKPINSISRGKRKIQIPSIHDFKLVNVTVEDNDDQSIVMTFSEPINASQDLKGIVDIDGISGETFSIAYNEVTVFLPNRIEGEHTLTVGTGVQNNRAATMAKSEERKLWFHGPLPRVRIKGEGSILPDSKGLIFPFESISLNSVTVRIIKIYENNVHHFLQVNNLNGSEALHRFGKKMIEKKVQLNIPKGQEKQWKTHVLDLEKWIRPEQGAIYQIGIKFDQKDAVCDCPKSEETEMNVSDYDDVVVDEDWDENAWEYYYWDDGYDDWDYYSEGNSPCDPSYYHGKAISRNILASNIGILFKMDEQRVGHAFITDMLTAQPLANVELDYMDFTKQVIVSGKTDAQGMLTTKLSRKPFVLVAKYGKQRGYLKLGDGYSNSLSKFDVDGEEVQNELKGYIYGERGVWRPGDSLYLNFVLQDAFNKLPKNYPIKFSLTNPSNQVIFEKTITKNTLNHYDFRTATSPDAQTGNYSALVQIGKREFYKTIRIETVKPNRLKMALDFDKVTDTCTFSGYWLHGAPAKDLRATVSAELRAEKTEIPGYKAFVFDSPLRYLRSNSVTIFDDKLGKDGKSRFSSRLTEFSEAPGMLKAVYTMRVFEKGGDFSIDRFSTTFSPFQNYVGMYVPNTEADGTLESGTKHAFPLVVVNENGTKTMEETKLHVKIYRMEWRWWYEQGDDDMVDFLGRNGNQVVFDSVLVAKKGESKFNFGTSKQEYGRYLITVTDEKGMHQTGQIVTFDWPYWSRSNRRTNEFASMLNFATDKKSYVKGEMVKVSFPSPSDGKALISVETRKNIVKKFWVNTVKGETNCSFETTADMAPNAYVHVTLIQPHAATTNDLPIRMYGVVPILVDDPATHLHPVIKVPKEWRPESSAKITVKEENGKPMTYTLAIVDDGLLDLTRFKTPNPWGTFYAREALGIKTWDMYNDVIGAFAGKLDRLLSIGGDGSADDGAGQKANRFKPMVHFIGPFTLPAGSSKTHTVQLPMYVGSVRVMVVAHNEKAYGSGEENVFIRKPLMVLGTLPRVLGPGETILLPVDVFSMDEKIKDVNVKVSVNGMLRLSKQSTAKLTFKEPGDEVVNFELKVADRMGMATVKIECSSGKETATQSFEVDVRSPNPVVVETDTYTIAPGKTAEVPVKMNGIKGSHELNLEFNSFEPLNLTGRMRELIHYPYGCIEQTTSAALPQLVLPEVMEFSEIERKEMAKNVQAALNRYVGFQTVEGGFGYWPGSGYADDWGTNYAGHLMLEAEERGYSLPKGLKTQWISYQTTHAQNWENNSGYIASKRADASNQLIQAYRLYTLALAGKPDLGSMNRMGEISGMNNVARWQLAAAYYLAGQKEVAKKMVKNLSTEISNYSEMGYDYGSTLRDKAIVLEASSLIGIGSVQKIKTELATSLSSSKWLSTQETGYSLLALSNSARKSGAGVSAEVNGLVNGKVSAVKAIKTMSFAEKECGEVKTVQIKNTGKTVLYITAAMSKVYKQGNEKTENKGLEMKIVYKDMDGKVLDPKRLKQGTDFQVELTLKNTSKTQLYKNLSIQQIFPCGWEIHNNRMYDASVSSSFYQDIRDDRVNSFFDLTPQSTQIIRLQLNAAYLGKYYLPATYSEAMYRRAIHAQQKGMWVEVVN